MTTKTYVEFLYAGSFFDETTTKEVSDRSRPTIPAGAFGYRFYDVTSVEQDGEVLMGKAKNHSGYYYRGEVFNLEQVEALDGDYAILISNMKCNGYDRVVRTIRGNFKPLREGDSVID
jgi:hypothetical protein